MFGGVGVGRVGGGERFREFSEQYFLFSVTHHFIMKHFLLENFCLFSPVGHYSDGCDTFWLKWVNVSLIFLSNFIQVDNFLLV